MNLLRMRGAWGRPTAWLYSQVIAKGMPPLYDRFIAEVVPTPPPSGLVIDVGCGDGQIAYRLARAYPTVRVLGLDLSPAMVARARRIHHGVDNLAFGPGDALALPLEDAAVDLAVSVASIKHWPDRARGMAELLRVLKAGGALCLLEAERGCSPKAARRFVTYWRHVMPGTAGLCAAYFRRFVAGQALALAELDALVRDAGFVDVETARGDELPFVVARARKAD